MPDFIKTKSQRRITFLGLVLFFCLFSHPCFAETKLPISSAYANNNYGSYTVSKTIDGNLSTYWRGKTSGYWWLSFDLGASQSLSKISIYWNKSYGSKKYYLYGSNDNKNFTKISGPFSSAGSTTNPNRKDHIVTGNYRYFAIEIITAQNSYPIIYETEAYGGSVQDTTPPTGTIKINNDAQYTNSTAVTLNLSATDSGSGMGTGAQMQFSNDNSTWSTAEAYATTKSWALASGDGTKTVYAKFKDVAGNWSTAVSDTIILDTTKPSTPLVTDDGATTTSTTQLHARWTGSDATSGISEYQYRITQDSLTGAIVVDWISVATATEITKTGLTLTKDKTYYFSVKAKDNVGLWSDAGYSDGIKVVAAADTTPPQVSLTSPSAGATLSGIVNINATATDNVAVAKVEFYIDASLVSSDTTSPYTYIWDTAGFSNGSHTLKVVAYDASSNTNNQQISVTVNNQASGQKLPIVWAYATNSTGSNDIFKAIDNNTATYWQGDASAGYWWISFNLESSQPLSKISIFWDKTYGSNYYELLGSNDEQNWYMLGGALSSAGGTTNPNRKDHVVSGSFRYFAIQIYYVQNSYPIIYEVEAYGVGTQDTTPPTGSIKINNDAQYTNSTEVNLNLSAADAGSGMGTGAQMQFSNDNTNWSTPEAYATTKNWTLTSGDGTKTVYVKFKDVAGNWSSAVSDTITLATTGPTGTIKINNDAVYTNLTAVTLTLSAQSSQSGVTISQMQFSNDNTNWSAAENYAVSKNWTMTSGDGTKTVYAKFRDSNGVWSNSVSDAIILDATPPQVILIFPSSVPPLSGVVNITATVTDNTGITKVDFYIDASLVSSDTASPYTYMWDTTTSSNGSHTFKAIAYDNASNTSSQQITVTVNNQASGQKLPISWAWASSTNGNYTDIYKTIDSNLSTSWRGQSAGYWWISFTFENPQPLSKISVYWDKDYGSTKYQVLGSNDADNWTQLSGLVSSVGATTNPNRKDFTVNGSYRYFAIEIFTPQNSYPIIYEVEAYGASTQDTTPPTGTIKINNDAQYTNSTAVTLNLSATDLGSGMGSGAQMQFSNDNTSWSTPEAYTTAKNWVLTSGDGTKTVYAKFKDAAGNWSNPVSDTIILDTTIPVITITSPQDGAIISGL